MSWVRSERGASEAAIPELADTMRLRDAGTTGSATLRRLSYCGDESGNSGVSGDVGGLLVLPYLPCTHMLYMSMNYITTPAYHT